MTSDPYSSKTTIIIILTFEKDIKESDLRKAYKYLGIEESSDIQHKNEKEKLKKEYLRRVRLVLGTELTFWRRNYFFNFSTLYTKCE